MEIKNMGISDLTVLAEAICSETGKNEYVINLGENVKIKYIRYNGWYMYYDGCQMSFKDYNNQEKLINYALRCING
jgi:hypothetical protein